VTVRIGKLIRLLSSDQPGEAAAAAAAIVRHLQATGKDIHQLADVVEKGIQADTASRHDDRSSWRDRRAWCAQHSEFLSARELEFITSLARWRGHPTPKQMDWLRAIEEKIRDWQSR
jgi:hypothetical protein